MIGIRSLALAAAVAVAGITGSASAQDEMMVDRDQFETWYGAAVAYERCNGVRFNTEEWVNLNARMLELAGGQLHAGDNLSVIEAATAYWSMRYAVESCRGARLSGALETFETELASAVGR